MSMPAESATQVVIVGGGPVGLGLAIDLGQRGVSCVLVERYISPQPIPKGQNLTQRTLEHFYFWGAEAELRAARTIPPDYGIGGMTCYGTLLSGYRYDWLQRELVRPFYFTDNERLPQYATEAVLRHRVGQFPNVETLWLERFRDVAGRRGRAGDDRRAQRDRQRCCGPTMWSAAMAAARSCANPPASPRPCPTTTG